MNIQFVFENGKRSVIDEYGRPEPMDYIVDEEQFSSSNIELSYTIFSSTASRDREKDRCNTVRCIKLLFERCLSAATAAKQLGIHVRTVQKCATQYEKDPDSIFEKWRKTGRPHILQEELLFLNALMRILLSS
ncbi:hypothetical protein BCV71DRAFT_261148 [Rhizopus microsporus]|uniref:Uncharacterized protein n=1 Tax=Rhizopus microsporus TaxID=58291 RepID=A0A1X0SB58_RHIZD|nr:hypothetical protein BCV71DRAFT_261148 [Rhizopus microsporus]